jgi:hypothetical protein
VVGDDLVAVGRGERLPAGVGRRGEGGDRVVEVADEAGGAAELGVTVKQVELTGPGGRAGDEGQDLSPVLVDAERAGRSVEAGLVQMGEQRVDGRRPRAGR